MPKRKNVSTLQRLCQENVARTMERVWFRDYRENYLSDGLLQELFLLMGEEHLLTPAVLDTFFVPQLRKLQLSICSTLVNETVVQAIAVRCKNLSSLDLQKCHQISANALVDLMKALPCLKELNLSETQCNTEVLSAVGSCCRHLRQLDITACERLAPDALFYLAYDPTTGSFCCPKLEGLKLWKMEARTPGDLIGALAFLLLALPLLRVLANGLLAEAVRLIHSGQFNSVPVPSGFPSLQELVQSRKSTHMNEGNTRLTWALTEMYDFNESSLPAISTACPYLQDVTVFLEDRSRFARNFLSCRHLAHLTLICTERRDLRDLLPLTASLGAQLETLSIQGFFFEEELSFRTLLSHCRNLVLFSASFLPFRRRSRGRQPNMEAIGWDLRVTPYELPQLYGFYLLPSDIDTPMTAQQAEILRSILVSLLKHSPCLEDVTLVSVPFSLDAVFEKVLELPGPALLNLHELSLIDNEVSPSTIHLLLSADNQLARLKLSGCPNIHASDYDALLQRVSRECFELNIVWD
uniref:F-box/LRR-repeat protein 15-like leucin rich repeat domain-containing protein n=1 Tax=Pogona vitticeps TaxID=103695 RepID=A0ABM5FID7_9SAUR